MNGSWQKGLPERCSATRRPVPVNYRNRGNGDRPGDARAGNQNAVVTCAGCAGSDNGCHFVRIGVMRWGKLLAASVACSDYGVSERDHCDDEGCDCGNE